MIYQPVLGDMIVVEHPYMRNRHVVAQVAKLTAKMVGLRYLNRRDEINEEVKQRRLDCILGQMRADLTAPAAQAMLHAATDAVIAAEKAAQAAYRNAIGDTIA